jgi:hypothetical protein
LESIRALTEAQSSIIVIGPWLDLTPYLQISAHDFFSG